MRTCDGLGVEKVCLTGYTPYPQEIIDIRLPHLARKLTEQIHKTALGAESTVQWEHAGDVFACIAALKSEGYTIVALEQNPKSIPLPEFRPMQKIALLLGREVEGVDSKLLECCDNFVEIPMLGRKESFNVVQAAAMTLYVIRFM